MRTQRNSPLPFKTILFALLASLLVSGCSVRVQYVQELFSKALEKPQDVTLSAEEIEQFPHAAQYITVDNQAQALMALAFDDNNLLKWRTGGDEIIRTFNGRLVGSVNLNGAIAHVSNLAADPLHCLRKNLSNPSQCPNSWQRQVWLTSATDAHLHDTAVNYRSEFALVGEEQLTLASGATVTAVKVEETSAQFTNTFWLEKRTGRTVKSRQFMAPAIGYAEIEEVKPYANDLKVMD